MARLGKRPQGTDEAVLGLVGELSLARIEWWWWPDLWWPEPTTACSGAGAGGRVVAGSVLELAVVGSGHHRSGYHHHSTRANESSPTSPRTNSFVPCVRFPSRATVSGLAGVESPLGLTHFDHDFPPCITDMWGRPLTRVSLGFS